MARLEIKRQMGTVDIAAVSELLDVATEVDGHHPLGEHQWLDLVHGNRNGFAGLVAWEPGHDHPVGYAQLTRDEPPPAPEPGPDRPAGPDGHDPDGGGGHGHDHGGHDHGAPQPGPDGPAGPDGHDPAGGHGHGGGGRRPTWALEYVVDPHHRMAGDGIGETLVGAALDIVRQEGGGRVRMWVPKPTADHDRLAAEAGLTRGRELRQLRRALPVHEQATVAVRPFVPGQDEEAWLEVNNRAFSWHPEQGGWDLETLLHREAQPWFDPTGFLLHERDGKLAAFCWTKVHHDEHDAHVGQPDSGQTGPGQTGPGQTGPGQPSSGSHRHDQDLGEIYVVAVDPAYQRLGLGRQLVLAGLDWLARRGIPTAMLYVDADNEGALHLYESMGFTVDHVDRAYVGEVEPIS